ncbi:MAG: hypothetical protein ACJ78V_02290 [Myxococcales bacterium]
MQLVKIPWQRQPIPWEADGITFEIASRRNLDSRVVVPFFRRRPRDRWGSSCED